MAPSEFWKLHPQEWWWIAEAKEEQRKAVNRKGQISEEEAIEMQDELRRARVAAGFPQE